MLVCDAYAYFKHRILTDTSISWRCVLSNCNGRVRIFQVNDTIINDHSHFPDPADFEKRKFRTKQEQLWQMSHPVKQFFPSKETSTERLQQ